MFGTEEECFLKLESIGELYWNKTSIEIIIN